MNVLVPNYCTNNTGIRRSSTRQENLLRDVETIRSRKFSLGSFLDGKIQGSTSSRDKKHPAATGDCKGRSMSLPSTFGNKKLLIVVKKANPANVLRSSKSESASLPPRSPKASQHKKKSFAPWMSRKPSFAKNKSAGTSTPTDSSSHSPRASFLLVDELAPPSDGRGGGCRVDAPDCRDEDSEVADDVLREMMLCPNKGRSQIFRQAGAEAEGYARQKPGGRRSAASRTRRKSSILSRIARKLAFDEDDVEHRDTINVQGP